MNSKVGEPFYALPMNSSGKRAYVHPTVCVTTLFSIVHGSSGGHRDVVSSPTRP